MDTLSSVKILLSVNLLILGGVLVGRHFITRKKYDYRDLWIRFSENTSGSLYLHELLPRVGALIADAMFVQQVAVWLRPAASDGFTLAYHYDPVSSETGENFLLHLKRCLNAHEMRLVYEIPESGSDRNMERFPIDNHSALQRLGIKRLVFVVKDNNILAILGVGALTSGSQASPEDDQLLASFCHQLGHLILTHRLSEELLLAREWQSLNRLASFILHDLKNLATVQNMTLENAKQLGKNPEFVADAFATFNRTTEKTLNLIASLSVLCERFSLRQQPLDILEVIDNTVHQLKIQQRNGLNLITTFPPRDNLPMILGDPELLQKAFTNLLLNAIQSLPNGEGKVELTLSNPENGKITAAIKDSGCGIPPEQLKNLFRPFQTTKKNCLGLGLSHTRSIVEVHGGRIRIESRPNDGTKVELEFPTLSRSQPKGTTSCESQNSSCG